MKITYLGTGTSFGIPVINCNCKCCTSPNPHDTRFRSSIKIESSGGTIVVVDTGPEFRLQALKYGLSHLDALFITHSHADHLHGLDDVRIFAHVFEDPARCTKPLDIYAYSGVNRGIVNRFDYIFKKTQSGGGKPNLNLIDCDNFSPENPIRVGDLKIVPVPMMHGNQKSTGWVFSEVDEVGNLRGKSFAYLTDCSFIPESSFPRFADCHVITIDALRRKPHSTHFNYDQAFDLMEKTKCQEFYFIHMTHEETEEEIFSIIDELKVQHKTESRLKVFPSYDGLILNL